MPGDGPVGVAGLVEEDRADGDHLRRDRPEQSLHLLALDEGRDERGRKEIALRERDAALDAGGRPVVGFAR